MNGTKTLKDQYQITYETLVELEMEPPPKMLLSAPGSITQNAFQGEIPEQQASCKSRYKGDMDMYFKLHTIYRDAKKEWEYYHVI